MTINWATIAGTGFIERQEEIGVLALALLTREHVLMVGDPGTAKSALAHGLCKSLGGKYFSTLMTRFSTPEEVFGPLSLKALENDNYERCGDGYLQQADVAFVDETFRANPSILNALLGILNERIYFEHGRATKVPLQMCIGATNDLPDDDAGLDALYDRFLFRQIVNAISEPSAFATYLMSGELTDGLPIDPQELEMARQAVERVKLSPLIVDKVNQFRHDLGKHKPNAVHASDRRWKKAIKALRAHAFLRGATEVGAPDLWAFQYCLWKKPEDREPIEKLLLKMAGPKQAITGLGAAVATMATGLSAYDQQYAPKDIHKNPQLRSVAKSNAAMKTKLVEAAKENIAKIEADNQVSLPGRAALLTEWNQILAEMS